MRFSRCHYEKMQVDASVYSSAFDLLSGLSDEFRNCEYDGDTILEMEIVGRVPLQFGVISRDLFEKIAAKLYYLKITDRTVVDFEPKEDGDIKEGFVTALCEKKERKDPIFEKALKAGLAALEGKPF